MSVTILVLTPEGVPTPGEVDGSLAGYQNVVGGLVEQVWSMPRTAEDAANGRGIDLVCNEEGLLKNLAPNIKWVGKQKLVGTLFFVRHDEHGDWVSLTLDDIVSIRTLLGPYMATYRNLSPQQYAAVWGTPLDQAAQDKFERDEERRERRTRIDAYHADEAAAGLI